MGQLKIDKSQQANEVIFTIAGQIDEDSTFSGAELSGISSVAFELEGILAINSCGIREWIKWMRTLPNSASVKYRKCPKVIIDQINMVSGFLPEHAKVESFFVPYYSEASGNEKMILFKDGVEFKGNEIFAPKDVKDNDGEIMELDVIEAKYFKFLNK
jgi:hypothetical protein